MQLDLQNEFVNHATDKPKVQNSVELPKVISSPFLFGPTINHHLEQYDTDIAKKIKRDIYMENYAITGANYISEAVDLYNRSKQILSDTSMNLREWLSKRDDVMKHIPESDRADEESMNVLGLNWNRQMSRESSA